MESKNNSVKKYFRINKVVFNYIIPLSCSQLNICQASNITTMLTLKMRKESM